MLDRLRIVQSQALPKLSARSERDTHHVCRGFRSHDLHGKLQGLSLIRRFQEQEANPPAACHHPHWIFTCTRTAHGPSFRFSARARARETPEISLKPLIPYGL